MGATTARKPKIRGAFHGAIPRITPRGSLKTRAGALESLVTGMIPESASDVTNAAASSMRPRESCRLICDQSLEQLISPSIIPLTSSPRCSSSCNVAISQRTDDREREDAVIYYSLVQAAGKARASVPHLFFAMRERLSHTIQPHVCKNLCWLPVRKPF
jgi:hypothetical protein